MNQYLSEAFKSLDSLNEDVFSINEDGLQDLVKFEEEDEDTNIIDIIDTEAETYDDLEDSYEGKIILDCSVCHSKQYKNIEDIIIEGDLANVGEECPFCYTNDGFKVIGQVAPFNKEEIENEKENNPEEPKENKEDTELKEAVGTLEKPMSKIKGTLGNVLTAHADELAQVYDAQSAIALLDRLEPEIDQKDYLKKVKFEIMRAPRKAVNHLYNIILKGDGMGTKMESIFSKKPTKETIINPLDLKKGDLVIGMYRDDGDDEFNNDPSSTFQKPRKVKNVRTYKDGDTDMVDVQFTDGNMAIPSDIYARMLVKENLEESVNNINVETDDSIVNVATEDDGKVTITTEPKSTEVEAGDEVIAPIEPEIQNEISDNVANGAEIEIDVDEFDEESFDELGESYLKKIYENIDTYKTSQVSLDNNTLKVEGVIKFKSGNAKKTSFLFEARTATKTGKVKFIGENTQITKGKKAFTITGNIKDRKFLSESLTYNYGAKTPNGKTKRLYGTIKM